MFPYWLWAILIFSGIKDKSMANLGEAWILCLLIALAALIRVVIGSKEQQYLYSKLILLLLCVASVAVYLFIPELPER